VSDLTHLDLFSRIGGFSLAAQRAGFRTVGFSEVEPYACRVLAERFPGVPNLGDVRKRESFAGLGSVTILTGGYPCQPFSMAGRRGGKDDDRHLWPSMRGIIEAVRPTWVIGENVLGHVTLGLDEVLANLESDGYAAQPFVVPACAVDAKHRRDRLWIIAHTIDDRLPDKLGPTEQRGEEVTAAVGLGRDVSNPDLTRLERGVFPSLSGKEAPLAAARCGENVADSASGGQSGQGESIERSGAETDGERKTNHALAMRQPAVWCPEPNVGRVADGIPRRMERLKGLGNAIVPQVVEPFFHWIAQIEKGEIA